MVNIVFHIACDQLAGNAGAAQHGSGQSRIVKADALSGCQSLVRVRQITALNRGSLLPVIADAIHQVFINCGCKLRIRLAAFGKLLRQRDTLGRSRIGNHLAGPEKGLKFILQCHLAAAGPGAGILCALDLLHEPEGIAAAAHVQGEHLGFPVGQVVIVGLLSRKDLEFHPLFRLGQHRHIALVQAGVIQPQRPAVRGTVLVKGRAPERREHIGVRHFAPGCRCGIPAAAGQQQANRRHQAKYSQLPQASAPSLLFLYSSL